MVKGVSCKGVFMKVSVFEYMNQKHEGQFRKDGITPYSIHPHDVSVQVAKISDSETLFHTALLHDIVEDTDTTITEIRENFGAEIAYLVAELTKDNEERERLKISKKEYTLYMMVKMSNDALIVKLSDRLVNIKDLVNQNDKEFTKYYLENTSFIMQNLERKRIKEGRDMFEIHRLLVNEIITLTKQYETHSYE